MLLLYIVPLIVFVIVSIILYMISNDAKKNKPENIVCRNVLPGIVVGLLVHVLVKYRETYSYTQEPIMRGNYFD